MMIKKLQALIPKNVDGILIVSPENRLYFTHFASSDGYLFVTRDDALFLTDSRYIEAAQKKVQNCRCEELVSLSKQLPSIAKEMGFSSLLTEADRLTVSLLSSLRKTFGKIRLSTVGTDKIINSLREIKTEEEIKNILLAQNIAERAFEHILKFIKPGISERDISLELDYFMLKNGAQALSFETIAVSGVKSSMPHGVPDGKIVENGDFITMDYGAVVNGYHSDMTRTVAVGKVSDKQRKVYNTVLTAQKNVIDFVKEGVSLSDADAAARNVIADAGYGEFFRHSTGHGVGIEIHEAPFVSPRAKAKLKKGNVITDEPGIYIPGEFGVRIEDMLLITENGCENFTRAPKELIII